MIGGTYGQFYQCWWGEKGMRALIYLKLEGSSSIFFTKSRNCAA